MLCENQIRVLRSAYRFDQTLNVVAVKSAETHHHMAKDHRVYDTSELALIPNPTRREVIKSFGFVPAFEFRSTIRWLFQNGSFFPSVGFKNFQLKAHAIDSSVVESLLSAQDKNSNSALSAFAVIPYTALNTGTVARCREIVPVAKTAGKIAFQIAIGWYNEYLSTRPFLKPSRQLERQVDNIMHWVFESYEDLGVFCAFCLNTFIEQAEIYTIAHSLGAPLDDKEVET